MAISDEDADRIANAMVRRQSVLGGVTPATAREQLDNLIKHDRIWGAKVSEGDAVANREFNELSKMAMEYEASQNKAQYESLKAEMDREHAEQKAAQDAAAAAERSALEQEWRDWAAQNPVR